MVVRGDASSVGWNQGLSDYEITKAFRRSNIPGASNFKDEVRRHAAAMEFTQRLESGEPDLKHREEYQAYLRRMARLDIYKMNRARNLDGGEIHTTILESRINEIEMAKERIWFGGNISEFYI